MVDKRHEALSAWTVPLVDGDLELRLARIYTLGDSPSQAPAYRFTMHVRGETGGTISLRIGQTEAVTRPAGSVGFSTA